jgi:hypothetical protein
VDDYLTTFIIYIVGENKYSLYNAVIIFIFQKTGIIQKYRVDISTNRQIAINTKTKQYDMIITKK